MLAHLHEVGHGLRYTGTGVDDDHVVIVPELVEHGRHAARRGELDGPTAWDGYATAACCEAGVAALRSGKKVEVSLKKKPSFYC